MPKFKVFSAQIDIAFDNAGKALESLDKLSRSLNDFNKSNDLTSVAKDSKKELASLSKSIEKYRTEWKKLTDTISSGKTAQSSGVEHQLDGIINKIQRLKSTGVLQKELDALEKGFLKSAKSVNALEKESDNIGAAIGAELDKANAALARFGDKSSEAFQTLKREVREGAKSLPEISAAAKKVEDELAASINKNVESIRSIETASGVAARGVKQRFADLRSGLDLAFGDGGSVAVGLRRAFFGLNDSSNLLARGLDKLGKSYGQVEIANDKVSQATFKTIQTMTKFSQAIEVQTNQLKQLGKQEGVDPRLASDLETQFNRIIKAQKDLEVEFKKTGKVSEGTFVRAQEEIEQASTAIELLKARVGELPPAFQSEFNKLTSRTQVFTNGLKELDVQRKRLDSGLEQTASSTKKLANSTDTASSSASKAQREFQQVTKALEEVEKTSSRVGTALSTVFSAAIGGGIGAAIGGAVSGVDLGGALDVFGQISNSARKITAAVGAPIEEVQRFGDIVKAVYGDNFGQSATQVGDAVQEVILRMQRFGEVSDETAIKATEDVFRISDTYGTDFKETIDAASILVQEFGISFDQAFDFISTGFQKGLNSNNDFLDSIREYGTQFSTGGASAEQFFNILDTGVQGGVLGTDKAADAFKEFRVRIQDGSKLTTDSLNQIGINSEDLFKKMASGQVTAAQAFEFVLQQLNSVDDQNVRMQAGVGLLGTQYEDLGKTALGLSTVGTTLESMAGATENLDIQYTSLSSQLTQFKRNVLLAFDPQPIYALFGTVLPLIQPLFITVLSFISQIAASITSFIQSIQESINQVVNGTGIITGAFQNVVAAIYSLMQGDWSTAWQFAVIAIQDMVSNGASVLISLIDQGAGWGYSFMAQVGQGIIEAGQEVLNAVIEIANAIAAYLAPGSPPKEGPLSNIDEWGGGLVDTFNSGFEGTDNNELLNQLQQQADDINAQIAEAERQGFVPAELLLQKAAIEDKLQVEQEAAAERERQNEKEEKDAIKPPLAAAAAAGAAASRIRATDRETYQNAVDLLDQRLDAGIITEEEYLQQRLRAEETWFDSAENTDREATAARIKEYQTRLKELQAAKQQEVSAEQSAVNEIKNIRNSALTGGAIFDPATFFDSGSITDTVTNVATTAADTMVTSLSDRIRDGAGNLFTGLKEAVAGAFQKIRDFIMGLSPDQVFPLAVLVGFFASPLVYPILNIFELLIPAITSLFSSLGGIFGIIKLVTGAVLKWSVAGLVVIGLIQNWDEVMAFWTETITIVGGTIAALIATIVQFVNTVQSSDKINDIVARFARGFSYLGLVVGNLVLVFKVLLKKALKIFVIDAIAVAIAYVLKFIDAFGGVEEFANAFIDALEEISYAFVNLTGGLSAAVANLAGGDLQNALREITEIPGDLANAFSRGFVVDFVNRILDALTELFPFLQGFVDFIKPWVPTILAVVGAGAVLAAVIIPLIPIISSIIGFVAALNPIVLILAAVIAAVVAVFYYWDDIMSAVSATLAFLQPVIDVIRGAIAELIPAFNEFFYTSGLAEELYNLWTQLSSLFMENLPTAIAILQQLFTQLGYALAVVGGIILDAVISAFQTFVDLLPIIGSLFAGLVQAVNGVIGVIRGLASIFRGIFQLISGDVSGGIATIVTGFGQLRFGVLNILSGLLQAALSIVAGLITSLLSFFGNFINNATSLFGGGAAEWGAAILGFTDTIAQGMPVLLQTIRETFNNIVEVVGSALVKVVENIASWVLTIIGYFVDLDTEVVGGSIVPDMVTAIIEWFTTLPETILSTLVSGFVSIVTEFFNLGVNLIQNLIDGVSSLLPSIGTLISSALPNIGELVGGLFGGGGDEAAPTTGATALPIDPAVFSEAISTMQSAFATFMTNIQTGIAAMNEVWTVFFVTLQTLWTELLTLKTTTLNTFWILVQTIMTNWQVLWQQFNLTMIQLFTQSVTTMSSLMQSFYELVAGILQAIIALIIAVSEAFVTLGDAAVEAGKKIESSMSSAANSLEELGQIVKNLTEGFNSLAQAAREAAAAAAAAGNASSSAGVGSAQGGDWRTREGFYMLHEDEMVLPKPIASAMRSTLEMMQRHGIGNQSFSGINPTATLASNYNNIQSSTSSGGNRELKLELTQIINNDMDQAMAKRQTIQWIQEALG